MKRRWAKIVATGILGAAAPHMSSNDWRVQSAASATVAVAALFIKRPQDQPEPKPQDPPKAP